jgi:hypothetical protein
MKSPGVKNVRLTETQRHLIKSVVASIVGEGIHAVSPAPTF